MSIEENKKLVFRYQEIYNSNDLGALGEVVAENLVSPRIMSGMPDWHTRIGDLIAEDNRVAARITRTGTCWRFLGMPAAGRKADITGSYIVRIREGRVVERWGEEKRTALHCSGSLASCLKRSS